MLIGYSSFFILVIRAQAGTPINENKPSDAVSLLSYLNREQYGDWPLLYGQSYNSPLDNSVPYLDGNPIYVQDVAKKNTLSVTLENNLFQIMILGAVLFPSYV